MSREDPQFKIRMPAALRDRIAEAASASNRTMNAEVLARLEQSFRGEFADTTPAGRLALISAVARIAGERLAFLKMASQTPETKKQIKYLDGLMRETDRQLGELAQIVFNGNDPTAQEALLKELQS